jgi:hypothetical protein
MRKGKKESEPIPKGEAGKRQPANMAQSEAVAVSM